MVDSYQGTAAELSPVLRHADLALRLARGERLRAVQVARDYRVTRKAAHEILARLAHVMPSLSSDRGVWGLDAEGPGRGAG